MRRSLPNLSCTDIRLFLFMYHAAPTSYILDPRGSGLLFFMFLRAQPYTCLGIELP
jgi:hypothetical protein